MILLYVPPAVVAGYFAAQDIGSLGLVPSPGRLHVFGTVAAVGFAVATFKGFAAPMENYLFGRKP
jgi:hypothetical protein